MICRYLIEEKYEERDYGTYTYRVWQFTYSDGDVEQLRQWVKK